MASGILPTACLLVWRAQQSCRAACHSRVCDRASRARGRVCASVSERPRRRWAGRGGVGWDGVGCAVQTLKSICVLAVGNPDAGISAAEFCVAVHLTQARGRCALLGGRFD
jgi:hypothetical protein